MSESALRKAARELTKALRRDADCQAMEFNSEIEAVEAILSAPEPEPTQEQGWQPIETAPKDGTWVLLATPSGRMADGCFGKCGAWIWPYVMVEPTHWRQALERPNNAAGRASKEPAK